MKFSSGKCVRCDREGMFAKPALKLCPVCNKKRLDAQKGKDPRKAHASPLRGSKKTGLMTKKRKPTGEAELFRSIWNSRVHQCTNCSEPLREPMRSFYFAHIRPKSVYPEYRLDPNNIRLLCFSCHRAYDQGTREDFEKRSFVKK